MTDREIMLKAEEDVNQLLLQLSSDTAVKKATLENTLMNIRDQIHTVTHSNVDYQIVVDNLDDNVLIADKEEIILYVNPAYEKHTGIPKEALIGHKVSEILKSRQYFSTATVPDVIKRREKVMKLSNMKSGKKPGIVVGIPIFNAENDIQFVVASNRSIASYADLRENFSDFVDSLKDIQSQQDAIHIYENVNNIPAENTMVGQGAEMKKIQHFISNVSSTDATVLITGESGVGKELIADAIYKHSNRSQMPFIKINCSSIPATLLESELFGYEKQCQLVKRQVT